ncbi:hypothetical protein LDVICp008 [lymphocystis disease virus-China]|uniref:Uncharacterized protein n=1 Tax=lymphocystis disease virus-China TaxID=256729 RepID=Q678K1_9VIRU|nr:hypothetical protein LDVICp008 [lymphocystis disease virus-China]AAU10856.1 hypothetical protein [lymphocystis disease virus-China]
MDLERSNTNGFLSTIISKNKSSTGSKSALIKSSLSIIGVLIIFNIFKLINLKM